ncbi:putative F-box domain-containing protein [Medicago truncatula]|uniref:Putative F-box domain-containing protein n=1 Tax=Medicago truncatula TaxID=3880 RepID=A0A396HW54_MEDTR|nr:putative F-box domain-containing protein [Medicago truncatula]
MPSNSAYIHEDIAFSILLKLPIKSLKRFECVRKLWSHLTEDEDSPFMTMYSNNLLLSQPYDGDTSLLINMCPRLERFHSLSGERFANRVSLINPIQSDCEALQIIGFGSVNGILCLQYGETRISLWNPTTNEFKVIPPAGTRLPHIVHKFKSKLVDPFYIQTTIHGFGYDSVADDYKLICLQSFEPYYFYNDKQRMKQSLLLQHKSLQPFWMIYSLTSNSWKKLYVNMPRSSPTFQLEYYHGNHRLYMDGVCHWLSLPTSGACMVSFDLNNETFFVTPIPSYILRVRRRAWQQLMVVNHSIALVSLPYHNTQTYHISIWGEVGVKESWIKLFTGENPCTLVEYPIGLGMNGELVFANEDNKLLLFDLNTKKIVELGLNSEFKMGFHQVNFYIRKAFFQSKRINN